MEIKAALESGSPVVAVMEHWGQKFLVTREDLSRLAGREASKEIYPSSGLGTVDLSKIKPRVA
jgi:hypothetical protein